MSDGPIFYPNVSPGGARPILDNGAGTGPGPRDKVASEAFRKSLDQVLARERTQQPSTSVSGMELGQPGHALKFSAHATQRIQERKIPMSQDLMMRMSNAVERAAAKGVEDTLLITSDAAFIVNVPSKTVVTALDKASSSGNVFTNIDGAVVV